MCTACQVPGRRRVRRSTFSGLTKYLPYNDIRVLPTVCGGRGSVLSHDEGFGVHCGLRSNSSRVAVAIVYADLNICRSEDLSLHVTQRIAWQGCAATLR
jgi:hypothetical protein